MTQGKYRCHCGNERWVEMDLSNTIMAPLCHGPMQFVWEFREPIRKHSTAAEGPAANQGEVR